MRSTLGRLGAAVIDTRIEIAGLRLDPWIDLHVNLAIDAISPERR